MEKGGSVRKRISDLRVRLCDENKTKHNQFFLQ